MKKSNLILAALAAACLALLVCYRALDRITTDTTPPVIEFSQQTPELSVHDTHTLLLAGVTATDKVDGDVTASLVVEGITLENSDGDLTVTYAAFDRAGNVAKAQRTARYTDYESPRFSLSTPLLFPSGVSFDVLSAVGATDTLDGDIQHRVRATSLDQQSIATPGVHQVRFQVTNSLGDTVTQVFPVEVYTAGSFDAGLTLTDYLIYLPRGEKFDPESYLEGYTLMGKTVDLTEGLPQGYTLRTKGTVDTGTPGTYPVEYRVTCADTARSYVGYTRLIVIVEG